jgi:predicted metalloprotease
MGLGGLLLLLVLSVVFKQDFFSLLQTVQDPGAGGPGYVDGGAPQAPSPEEEPLVDFVDFIVKDAQDVWTAEFQQLGQAYQRAKLVLFTDSTRSGCGYAAAAMGPFYCPADGKVYIDLGFYRELKSRFGAPGDFAQAYVIAHEIGHHVQTLLGLEQRLSEERARRPNDANALSVRFELQADCLAGVWAHSTQQRDLLERGDVEEGLSAAAAVGDDRIQKQSGAAVNPETWTHGSSSQRVAWFTTGFRSGQLRSCDTFAAAGP